MIPSLNEKRHLIIEVRWGASAGRKAVVSPGETLRIGRHEPAVLTIPHDTELLDVHLEMDWDGNKCALHNLAGQGRVLVNGQPVGTIPISNGDWIRAGRTDFSVYFENHSLPPTEQRPPATSAESRTLALNFFLKKQNAPLFALLDAARTERILVLLRESVHEYRSLYEGPQGEEMADTAPYLVELHKNSQLLSSLVSEGWGKSWGIFLISHQPFHLLRRHLRKFLLIEDASGRELYFRFYDPRVLRTFLPTCTPEQTQNFFADIEAYFLESTNPSTLLRFEAGSSGPLKEVFSFEPFFQDQKH